MVFTVVCVLSANRMVPLFLNEMRIFNIKYGIESPLSYAKRTFSDV